MPKPRRLSRTCHFVRLPTAFRACARCCRCLVRFTTLHALRRSARAPCSGFSPPHRGVNSKLFSSGPPLTPLSPHRFAHHARATMSTNSAEIAFPVPPREERTASTTRDAFHRDDAERPAIPLRAPAFRVDESAILPPRLAVRRPFARRGLPLWASPRSPGRRSDTSFFGQ